VRIAGSYREWSPHRCAIHAVFQPDAPDEVSARVQDPQSQQQVEILSGRNDIPLYRLKEILQA
jgi:hypothetical protein